LDSLTKTENAEFLAQLRGETSMWMKPEYTFIDDQGRRTEFYSRVVVRAALDRFSFGVSSTKMKITGGDGVWRTCRR
jgi:hypothetical protein